MSEKTTSLDPKIYKVKQLTNGEVTSIYVFNGKIASQNEEESKKKFKNSQYYSRVENYMEDLYKNTEYRKKFGDGQLLKLCETTFDKFFSAAYEAAKKRHERTQNDT
jgi:hypothetical protein